jgi:hypothetical protein
MAAMSLLRRLALGEVCLLHELQEGSPYALFSVNRIDLGPQRWCIIHVEMDKGSHKNLLLQTEAFSEAEELQICVRLLLCVIVYTGRIIDGKLSCIIVTCDTVTGGLVC